MANRQTWQAFLVLDEARWLFLGLSPWPDQLIRWCRRSLRLLIGRGNYGRVEVVLYSCDDRPSPSKRKPRFRPFSANAPPQDGWQQKMIFHRPFEDLLSKRQLSRSNGKPKTEDHQRMDRPRAARTRVPLCVSAFDESSPSADAVKLESAEGHNNLLFWLSAAGAGRRSEFLHTCQILGLVHDGSQARLMIRRLVLLGHLSDDGVRWTMQPPTLSPLALEPERVVLRGQRTPALLACLPDDRENISQQDGPDRICCSVQLEEGVPTVAVGGTCFRVEQCILGRAQKLPDWRAWAESLRRFDGRDLGKFVRSERWDGMNWVGTPLYYDDVAHRIIGPGGMYRLSQDTSVRSPLTVCFEPKQQMIVRGDWYGLRFLAGRLAGDTLHATWDQARQEFLVPTQERWPFLYEQVLVQASGLLPSPSRSPGWLCYHGVPKELAECLCEKLDVEIRATGSGHSYHDVAT